MDSIPRHYPIVVQVVEILRRKLQKGEWTDRMPGERPLCRKLQVSRTTLRKGLKLLRRDGVLKISQGRRSVIIVSKPRGPHKSESSKVVLFGPAPFHSVEQFQALIVDELRMLLQSADLHLEVMTSPKFHHPNVHRTLPRLVRETRAACWILWSVAPEIQRWFSAQDVRALVFGSCPPDLRLPSVDMDHFATCQHGTSLLLSKGHRRLALVIPKSEFQGDLRSEEGFLAALKLAPEIDAPCGVISHHDGTIRGICAALKRLFCAQNAPTALLVTRPFHVLTVMSHLARMGLRIPSDVSLLSRDNDAALECMTPLPSRYSSNIRMHARKASRLVIQLARGESVSCQPVRITPQWLAGETIASPGKDD